MGKITLYRRKGSGRPDFAMKYFKTVTEYFQDELVIMKKNMKAKILLYLRMPNISKLTRDRNIGKIRKRPFYLGATMTQQQMLYSIKIIGAFTRSECLNG